MTEKAFWDLIETDGHYQRDDPNEQLDAITHKLHELPEVELVSFSTWFLQKLVDSYAWKLWGAAYLINGGCSDDGFDYFRCWLISRGRKVFDAALANPDSLAKVVDIEEEYEFEDLGAAAYQVYMERFNTEIPAPAVKWPEEPLGEDWDFDDDEETARRLPKMARKYSSDDKTQASSTPKHSLDQVSATIRNQLGSLSLEEQISFLESQTSEAGRPEDKRALQSLLAYVLLEYGTALDRDGQTERAVDVLVRCLDLDPDRFEAYLTLGYALKYLRRWKEASDVFTRLEDKANAYGASEMAHLAHRNVDMIRGMT